MVPHLPARPPGAHEQDVHGASYLRARAHHLRVTAATSRDPEIARALREVAGDFDAEAQREEVRHAGPNVEPLRRRR